MAQEELDKIVGLVVARGVIGGLNFPVKSLWERSWGCPMFSQTMARDRLSGAHTSLRFNLKIDRRRNLKFWLAVDVESEQFLNGLLYIGKVSVSTDVVIKLIAPLFQGGYNITCDNFSPHLTWRCNLR